MLFKAVAGQDEIKARLIKTVAEERISHAQLFLGPTGHGGLPLALAYAQFVCCDQRSEDDSCGECPACTKYMKLIHPDLHFVFPVATAKSITKDPVSDDFIAEWRKAIIENPYMTPFQWFKYIGVENKQGIINKHESSAILRKLNLKTFESDYKIMIIWMPEKMNLTAANKLLKMIEEPPAKTLFILVAENTDQIIPTILSRTQLIKIPKIDEKDIYNVLVAKYENQNENLQNAANLADGDLIKAIEYVDSSEESELNFNRFISIMRLTYSRSYMEIFDWVEEISATGREKQKNFLLYAMRLIRENYLLNMKNTSIVRLSSAEKSFSDKFSSFIHHDNAPVIIDELNKACLHIEANAYARIVFLDFAMKLVKLIR